MTRMKLLKNQQIKTSVFIFILFFLSINSIQCQVSKTVNISIAGTLRNNLTAIEKETVTDLTITGRIDARDIKYMRDSMPVLAVVEMSEAYINAYSGTGGTINGSVIYGADEIPEYSFLNTAVNNLNSTLHSVTLPNSLKTIKTFAFCNCVNTSTIFLPSGLKIIEENAFFNCVSLDTLINCSITPLTINPNIFYGITLNNVHLVVPSSAITSYSDSAVWNTFGSITGGGFSILAKSNHNELGSVIGVKIKLFSPNELVTLTAASSPNVIFENWTSNNTIFSLDSTITFNVDKDTLLIANFKRNVNINITTAGSLSNNIPNPNTVTNLTITGNINAKDIRFIKDSMLVLNTINLSNSNIVSYTGPWGTVGDGTSNRVYAANQIPLYSFNNRINLTTILLPNSTTAIDINAFQDCGTLTSIVIPNSVSIIDEMAFANDTSLVTILLPADLTTIGYGVFANCTKLKSIIFPSNLTSIGYWAFSNTGLDTVYIPSTLTTINHSAFVDCQLLKTIIVEGANPSYKSTDNVLFSKNQTTLHTYPAGINDSNYIVPNGVETILVNSFYNNHHLAHVEFPNSLAYINDAAFSYCNNLDSITLPPLIDTLKYNLFSWCTNLKSITLTSVLHSIQPYVFSGCSSLTQIINPAIHPLNVELHAFDIMNQSLCTLMVPDSSVVAYQNANAWKYFNPIIGGATPIYLKAENQLSTATFSIFPNPAKDFINIVSSEIIKKAIFINMKGQTVLELDPNRLNITIPTKNISTGIYTIHLILKNGNKQTTRIIVN